MKKSFLIFIILLFMPTSYAQEEIPIALEKAPINIHNQASIKRGAKFFATTCMVCHTLIYMRYDKLAQTEGVLYDKMPINVKAWPFDIKPPDLSLEVSRRGADWVYTYLHSFYTDPKRPTGVNNLVLPNTAMSGILVPLQGQQIRLPVPKKKESFYQSYQWYDLVELTTPGTMTTEQFDATVTDVVNFLTYASAPYRLEQEYLGWWVLGFLMILFVLVYVLKKAYWHNLQRKK